MVIVNHSAFVIWAAFIVHIDFKELNKMKILCRIDFKSIPRMNILYDTCIYKICRLCIAGWLAGRPAGRPFIDPSLF